MITYNNCKNLMKRFKKFCKNNKSYNCSIIKYEYELCKKKYIDLI